MRADYEVSLTGTAALCLDVALVRSSSPEYSAIRYVKRVRGRARKRQVLPSRDIDAPPAGTCRNCGMIGQHLTAAACIASLRDRLARW